ncbi:retrovirus-related pol polyprotein from transposon TNT 1-94 [Tanacetum coccineum]
MLHTMTIHLKVFQSHASGRDNSKEKEDSRSSSLLDVPNDPVPSLLPIISCPILSVRSKCDHTYCQLGNLKEIYTELLRSFAKLEKHSISLEIALQQCQEQLKNDTVCKEKASNVFRKEREQYFEIQDLKAQLQDKNIAICELKKLIEKCKGKSVDTKFDKPSVVRQPNAQRIPKPSVLGKPAPFSDSLERKNFAKKKSVSKTNESEGLSKPVTPQNLPRTATQAVSNTNVIKPGMYRIESSTTQTRAPQLTQTSRNTNPRVSTSTGVAHRTNVSRPQPRSNQMKDKVLPNTSQVKFKKTEVEDHPRISSISNQTKSFLNDVNARTKKPNVVPISTRKPKSQANKSVATPHKKTAASESTTTNSKSYYRMLYKKTSKAWKWWIAQQCPSAYKWVPKTKRKWVPKVRNESVNKKVSFAIDNVSRRNNSIVLKLTKPLASNLSCIPSSPNSLADCILILSIVIRMHKAHDGQSITAHHQLQAWQLWHRRLSHLNFDYINLLSKKDVVIGLPKLKYVKDQLYSSYEVSKAKRSSFKTKTVPSSKGRDGENLDKMKEKGDPCILVGYSTQSKGYRVYNKRTRLIVESIHLRFDEIKEMFETSVANDTSGLEFDLLFGTSRVNKSSSPTDNSIQKDILPSTHIQPTSEQATLTNVHAEENNDDQAEFTNPFCTPVQETAESSSRNIDPEMCMFALTMSTAEPKNIKEAMADSTWIEAK